jgi:PST family polysaccharide transporter
MFYVFTPRKEIGMKHSIGVRAVRGVAWLGSGQLVRQVLAFATNIALARMLFPDDFGLFGMAFAAAEVAQILTDFGLGAALIQRRESHPIILTTCFWLNIAIGLIVALSLVAISPLLVNYFGRPEIYPLVLPLSLNILLSAALVVPMAVLTQNLRFRDITVAQTFGSIVASIGAIGLAATGFGVMALAMQPLIGNFVAGVVFFVKAKWLPLGWPNFGSIRGMVVFSAQLLGNNLIGCVGRNLHAAILGKQLGSSSLGFYNLASGMTGTVLFQVSSVIVRVLFPTLSSLRDEPERLRKAWFKACSAIAIVALPAMAGIIAVAPDLVPVVFGQQWIPVVDVLRILSVTMAIQSVLTTSGTILMSLGRADLLLHTSMASIVAIGAGLWIGAAYGIEGAATGYALAGSTTYLLITMLACREAGTKVISLVRELMPWILASIGMCIGVILLAATLDKLTASLRLFLCVMAGGVLYGVLLFLIAREQTTTLFSDVRSRLST